MDPAAAPLRSSLFPPRAFRSVRRKAAPQIRPLQPRTFPILGAAVSLLPPTVIRPGSLFLLRVVRLRNLFKFPLLSAVFPRAPILATSLSHPPEHKVLPQPSPSRSMFLLLLFHPFFLFLR